MLSMQLIIGTSSLSYCLGGEPLENILSISSAKVMLVGQKKNLF
jgi:hypothetical protein